MSGFQEKPTNSEKFLYNNAEQFVYNNKITVSKFFRRKTIREHSMKIYVYIFSLYLRVGNNLMMIL